MQASWQSILWDGERGINAEENKQAMCLLAEENEKLTHDSLAASKSIGMINLSILWTWTNCPTKGFLATVKQKSLLLWQAFVTVLPKM